MRASHGLDEPARADSLLLEGRDENVDGRVSAGDDIGENSSKGTTQTASNQRARCLEKRKSGWETAPSTVSVRAT